MVIVRHRGQVALTMQPHPTRPGFARWSLPETSQAGFLTAYVQARQGLKTMKLDNSELTTGETFCSKH
jgi:hypothetical protein